MASFRVWFCAQNALKGPRFLLHQGKRKEKKSFKTAGHKALYFLSLDSSFVIALFLAL